MEGCFSERLGYNRDPMSYNCGQLTIDDEGNMDMRDDSHSPYRSSSSRDKQAEEDIEDNEETKTFISSHLLLSHLMTNDAEKNTLSQLNQANRACQIQKCLQREARGGDLLSIN